MRIKTKLTLGVGLLFLLILLSAAVGIRYSNAISHDIQNVLRANYNTLEYVHNMLDALAGRNDLRRFEENLRKQQSNLTEVGEQALTRQVETNFKLLIQNPDDDSLEALIQKALYQIVTLNMNAIVRKSDVAKATAKKATIWISVTGALCFSIAFLLLINFPSHISNPIRELTDSIKKVASKNYSQRVHFERHDEFGDLARSFNTMAQKLEEYESSNLASLLIEKKRIETIINNMHDPIVGLSTDMKILFVNNEAVKILGADARNLVGKLAQDVAVSNDLMRSLIKDLILPENVRATNLDEPLKIYADNKESFFQKEIHDIFITPTGEDVRHHIGYVIILNNVTPYKELDLAKTNFIATVSHELKTPISSIKMSLQLLQDARVGTISSEQQQLIENINADTERLLKITGELLNMAQVESGNIHLKMQAADPRKIIEYAVETTRFQAEQKQVRFEINTDSELPKINADSEKTAWVMINLLSNAIRYSPERSSIIIEAKRENGSVLFSVKDFGKGIDARYKNRIFDRYFQIPGTNTKSGIGLGLAISKEFIEAQGGKIWVESEVGSGSRFFLKMMAAELD